MVIFHGELDDFVELVWEKSEHRLNTMVWLPTSADRLIGVSGRVSQFHDLYTYGTVIVNGGGSIVNVKLGEFISWELAKLS